MNFLLKYKIIIILCFSVVSCLETKEDITVNADSEMTPALIVYEKESFSIEYKLQQKTLICKFDVICWQVGDNQYNCSAYRDCK